MIALDADKRRRLIASARLLESDKEGERAAAMGALLRLLPRDVTLADLLERSLPQVVELQRPWQRRAADILQRSDCLDEKEFRFVLNIGRARFRPSEKQMAWLDDIAERLRAAA